jgi:predicted RNase H-like HicB family nuclease
MTAMSEYTAIVKQSGDDWIGWIEEVPGVNCQEGTREELLVTLRVTLAEALELNRADARSAATEDFEEIRIAV